MIISIVIFSLLVSMRSNTISNWRDSTAQWIDTTGFLSRTQTSWNNLELLAAMKHVIHG